MVNCWFWAPVFWIPTENERDWDSWVYPDSNPKTTGPQSKNLSSADWFIGMIMALYTPPYITLYNH